MSNKLRIGTRGSTLALAQAKSIASLLKKAGAASEIEIVTIKTSGDRAKAKPAATGVFTKEIEKALLRGRIDLAVHSMKDLPTTLAEGLCIGAVPGRLNPLDVLVARDGGRLDELKPGATAGTGSPRRRAQILARRADLRVVPLRGNLDTRLRKVSEGEIDCAVVAMAGLMRLGRASEASEILIGEFMLPAPGQGALAVEARSDDGHVLEIVRAINHPDSLNEVTAERALLRATGAGCRAPLGALARIDGGRLVLKAVVLDADGKRWCAVRQEGVPSDAEEIGRRAAEILIEKGAGELIKSARAGTKE
ncbi:MAG: hydroxymethylbilane synthase [Planctomycetota bacterium]